MKRKLILITFLILTTISSKMYRPEQAPPVPDKILLEDFHNYSSNPFSDWKFRERTSEAAAVYSVMEENGRKFLRGSTVKSNFSVQLGKHINENNLFGKNKIHWNIESYPFLSWEWRVKMLPEGANENQERTNDSAAGIYVVFQRVRVPIAGWQYQPANWIKYVWSSTLPVGTVVSRKFKSFGLSLYEGRYIVVATGEKNLGKWITFKRNVLEDYITYFGKKTAPNPIVIGILTDSNDTDSQAEADYGNIIALPD